MMPVFASACRRSPKNVVVSIDACTCYSSGEAIKALPAYREERLRGTPPWRPQAGNWDEGTDDGADGPTIVGRSSSCRISSPTSVASVF